MLIKDLTYLEISDKSIQVEGGTSPFDAFGFSKSFDGAKMTSIKTISASGAGGTTTGSEGVDMSRFTAGGTFLGWKL